MIHSPRGMSRGGGEVQIMGTGNDALLVSVMEAARPTGKNRNGTYRCLAPGDLRARKIGRTTWVETSSSGTFVEGLPEA